MFELSGVLVVQDDYPSELLTEREQAVLQSLADGFSNEEIGARLWLSTEAVQRLLNNVYDKLLVHGRPEAVVRGRMLGLLHTETFSLLPLYASLTPVQ